MEPAPGARLAHYRLVEKLGEGGMGVVWKALDTELNRHVAVKILPAALTSDEERRLRFRREAQAAAALSHPNIAVIHQVGEHEGSPFIAMELVTGMSLRDRLSAGSLPVRDWIALALPVAEGLAHAHRNGVVHRDLKPDNVMIASEGQVKLLDFGLAKLVQPAEEPGGSGGRGESRLRTISRELTRAGKVFGTVSYMSPEQARGEPVDHRSDLFSLGTMLYEMATGRLPFKAGSDVETLSAVIAAEPRPVLEAAPDLPPECERIVRKAMEKDPADRYQGAADMVVDLRNLKRDLDSGRASIPPRPASGSADRVASGASGAGAARAPSGSGPIAAEGAARGSAPRWWALVAALGLLVGAFTTWSMWQRSRGEPDAARGAPALSSVAVLPFESAGSDEDAEYLGDGVTESIINGLSRIGSLRVVPRSVVFAWKGKAVDPLAVGEELGVAAIVTGRVSRRGDSLVVSSELIDVASLRQLWGERYSRTPGDIFEVQETITKEIARQLRVEMTAEEEREIADQPTDNPEAYEAYLRGQGLAVGYSRDELDAARRHFERALEIDPDYALAFAGLATVESQMHRNFTGDPAELERAMEFARRALAIDPDLARAHAALGEIYAVQYRYREAVEELETAIRLQPDEPSYHDNLSWVLAYLTPPEGERAERAAREAIRLSPTFAFAYYHLGRALLAQGRIDEAKQAFTHGGQLGRNKEISELGMGQAFLAEGRFEEALRRLESFPSYTALHDVYIAAAHVGLGERERALALIEGAVQKGYRDAPFLEASPWFEPLRSHPRFSAALEAARGTR